MIKRMLAVLMALTALASFASCAGNEDTEIITDTSLQTVVETATTQIETTIPETTAEVPTTEKQEETQKPSETTEKAPEHDDIGPLFKQYVIEEISDGSYTMKFKQLGIRLITTIDGGNSVIESKASGILQITLISKDGRYFMVVPTTKKYVEMSAAEYAEQAESFNGVSVSFEGIKLIGTGEETVMGTAYKTETYDEGDRGTVTYYFTDSGLKRLRSVKDGKTNDVETFEISSDVDASAFEIPENYTQVDDPGQVMLP